MVLPTRLFFIITLHYGSLKESSEMFLLYLLWSGLCGVVLILMIRMTMCLPAFGGRKAKLRKNSKEKISTMVIWGSGGHTAEMILLLRSIQNQDFAPLHYILAETDKTSKEKIESAKLQATATAKWHTITRSREVKQNWLTTLFTAVFSLIHALLLILKIRPQLIICNGPGTCVPLCYAAFLFKIIGLLETKIIFVESFCRVDQLSLTGKLLYLVSDRFIVQWQKLLTLYPRAEYLGDGRSS